MSETVQVSGVTKSYGKVRAVTDVSCVFREGETIALVGHNGAGKTTLIKLMLGPSGRPPAPSAFSAMTPRPASSKRGAGSAICRKAYPSTWP